MHKPTRTGDFDAPDRLPQDPGSQCRESSVAKSLSDLHARVEGLTAIAKRLYERLAPVMDDAPPSSETQPALQEAPCALANTIDKITVQIVMVEDLIRDAHFRLGI